MPKSRTIIDMKISFGTESREKHLDLFPGRFRVVIRDIIMICIAWREHPLWIVHLTIKICLLVLLSLKISFIIVNGHDMI